MYTQDLAPTARCKNCEASELIRFLMRTRRSFIYGLL